MEDSMIGMHRASWKFDPEKDGGEVIIPDPTMTDDENPEWTEEMERNAPTLEQEYAMRDEMDLKFALDDIAEITNLLQFVGCQDLKQLLRYIKFLISENGR